MGGCGSKQSGCLGLSKNSCKLLKRRKRRGTVVKSSYCSSPRLKKEADQPWCSNATFRESRFDPTIAIESDDDFHSVQDAFTGTDNESTPTNLSPFYTKYNKNTGIENANQLKSDDQYAINPPVFLDEISIQHEKDDASGILSNCGLLSNSCLPCLAPSPLSEDKRMPPSLSPPSTRKKAALKVSFFGRDEYTTPPLLSPKALLQRPIAGSQVPFCPLEKVLSDSWSPIEPSTFKVRGPNYLRDKKKESASNYAAYTPFGVDVYLSPRKINHIARFVELPASNSYAEVPSILVVNLQIPLYPTAILHSEIDGKGMSFVLYFKLSGNYSKALPLRFQENLRRLIDDEVERVRGFPMDTISPFRERLKILGRVVNVDNLHLSAAERKLMSAYNEKPVLSRPQHEFYLGENYLEIDLDMHRFGYIPRKGFEAFQERLKLCILDFGLTIQGNKAEDLPENVLCCVRLKEIDHHNYHQLVF